MLAIFVNMAGGTTLFYHAHFDVDGQRTVHSHPFIPGSDHSHTGTACQALQMVVQATQTMMVARTLHLAEVQCFVYEVLSFSPIIGKSRTVIVRAGRAPPAMAA